MCVFNCNGCYLCPEHAPTLNIQYSEYSLGVGVGVGIGIDYS